MKMKRCVSAVLHRNGAGHTRDGDSHMPEYLLEKLQNYSESDFYPLHMPGHKRRLSYFERPFAIDITEIDGFDNLHHAQGILLEAQRRAARLYGAEETYYLVNGSTCGILAAICAAAGRGGKLLMARNSHKAAYHGVLLNDLEAVYLYPEADVVRGINGGIRPEQVEEALRRHPDIRSVLITSPTYDGVVSDIRRIAETVHRAGAVLIVDEAHGAHFVMHPYFPESAVACGADLVINSLHKTMPSLTQTALLHVQGERVDREKLRRYLGIYQSSSPSYVLMAGMDECVRLMEERGGELFAAFTGRLNKLRARLGAMQTLHLVNGREQELYAYDFDRSKVLVSTENSQMTGAELSQILRCRYHLEAEMEAENYVTAILTVCDTEEGFERLEGALTEIDDGLISGGKTMGSRGPETLLAPNEAVLTIAQAENREKIRIALRESRGEVSAEFAYLYPPGIPLLVPGERIPEDLPQKLEYYRLIGLNLQGLSDYTGESIQVVQAPSRV